MPGHVRRGFAGVKALTSTCRGRGGQERNDCKTTVLHDFLLGCHLPMERFETNRTTDAPRRISVLARISRVTGSRLISDKRDGVSRQRERYLSKRKLCIERRSGETKDRRTIFRHHSFSRALKSLHTTTHAQSISATPGGRSQLIYNLRSALLLWLASTASLTTENNRRVWEGRCRPLGRQPTLSNCQGHDPLVRERRPGRDRAPKPRPTLEHSSLHVRRRPR